MTKFVTLIVLVGVLTACSDQGVTHATLTASGYSVPRYVDYPSVRVLNVTNTSTLNIEGYEITARCEEHTFESLEHVFSGSFSIAAGETKTILIPYERGYPYFTGLRVECDIDVPTRFGQAMVALEF